MTIEETIRAAEIMQASTRDGVEYWERARNGQTWYNWRTPTWDWYMMTCAVRLPGKVRPYVVHEMFAEMERRRGAGIVHPPDNELHVPVLVRYGHGWYIELAGELVGWDALTEMRWDDGTPCGVQAPGEWLTMPGVEPPKEAEGAQ